MNLTIREQPIFEDESQAKQAMDDMANTLRMVGCMNSIRSYIADFCSVLSIQVSGVMQVLSVVAATSGTQSSFQTRLYRARIPRSPRVSMHLFQHPRHCRRDT